MLSTIEIYQGLNGRYANDDQISLELIDGAAPAINLTMHDFGDMQIQLAASGQQILVSTVLAPADRVKDAAGLNEACLLLNPINPLSNLGIAERDGKKEYIVFGELSAASNIDAIDEEIRFLAANTIDAAETLQHYFA
jgi:uncharacterized protein YjfI (DUF2170 family)